MGTAPKSDIVLLLTHMRDCGAPFDRDRVHWSILAEIDFSTCMSMDYTTRIWFKLDTKWIKADKK